MNVNSVNMSSKAGNDEERKKVVGLLRSVLMAEKTRLLFGAIYQVLYNIQDSKSVKSRTSKPAKKRKSLKSLPKKSCGRSKPVLPRKKK